MLLVKQVIVEKANGLYHVARMNQSQCNRAQREGGLDDVRARRKDIEYRRIPQRPAPRSSPRPSRQLVGVQGGHFSQPAGDAEM